jgi:hypothetical protein
MLYRTKFAEIPETLTLQEAHDEFSQLLQTESANHHRMGQLYNHVVKHKLAEKAQYPNALAYFSKHFKAVARSTLLAYSAVAKTFTEPVTTEFGVTRLKHLLTYKEVADITLNDAEPGSTPIEVPDKDGVVALKPFKDCTVEELRKAIVRKRKPSSSKPLPPEVLSQVEEYRNAVISRFPDDVPVDVKARKHNSEVLITFKDIPMSLLDGLAEILLDRVYSVSESDGMAAAS